MTAKIKFCGAAGTVTGSCYWIRLAGCQFLVDCGMFQGSKTIKELNYGSFPFSPAQIDFVLLTHAHIDHSGLLPKLVKHGFKGPIYATEGTRDLLTYMLPDSAYIQEMEVERLNRRNRQRGRNTVEPIYDHRDALACLETFRTVEYQAWQEIGPLRVRFWNAGHILGAASIEVEMPAAGRHGQGLRLLFSGDIGPEHKLFHPEPEAPAGVDILFCESTYGGRVRQDVGPASRRALLAHEINEAMKTGGPLLIPSFAVERTQELLLDLQHLLRSGDIPCLPVFIDSPLAIRITSVFADHADDLEDMGAGQGPFDHPSFHFTGTVEESKGIGRFKQGVIIMAASGMCDAGRIRHHLKNHLWRAQATVLLVGYQAEGTLGRLLEDGKKRVKIQGEDIEVKARIRTLDVYSGHADGRGLIDWVAARLPVHEALFLTHGSETSLAAMRDGVVALGLDPARVIVPKLDDEYDLAAIGKGALDSHASRRIDPEVVGKPDWHNGLAELTIDIRDRLEGEGNDRQRETLLARLRETLDAYKAHNRRS